MLSKYVADESDLEIRNILPWNCVCRRIYDWTYYSVFKKNVTDEYTRAKLKKKKKQFFIHRNFTHWRNQSSSSFYFN